MGLAALVQAWRAPVRVWRCPFRQGALASSRRCFSTSSIRTPPRLPITSLPTLAPHYLHTPTQLPSSSLPACLACATSGLPHLGLGVGLTSLLPPSLRTAPTQRVPAASPSSSTMTAPRHSAATARIRLMEPADDAVLHERADLSNPLGT